MSAPASAIKAVAPQNIFQQAKASFLHPEHGWKTTHFWGPIANWGIVVAAVYDATQKGPETISPGMTAVMLAYSSIFSRFAVRVQPVNYLLFSCHCFNICAQSYQMARYINYYNKESSRLGAWNPISPQDVQAKQQAVEKLGKGLPLREMAIGAALAIGAGVVGPKVIKPQVEKLVVAQGSVQEKIKKALLHPAGPFTVHCYAPLFKWMLSIQNMLEFDKPLDKISIPQQTALAATGFIWSRYSLVITPVNYSLFAVNFTLGCTGFYQLLRKVKATSMDGAATSAPTTLSKKSE